jgi:hemoglobin
MPSIYDRLGGHDAVRLAVDRLYDRVTGDPVLAPYFAGVDIGRLARHMRPFIAAAVGGPDVYRGRDMGVAHAGLGITHAHFDRTVAHLVAVLDELGAGRELIDDIGARLEPLRSAIVGAAPASNRLTAARDQKSMRITTRRGVGRLTSAKPAAAKTPSVPT